ncbi:MULTISPECIES: hypothetical protein [unclassified Streptomyces]|uniref:hypothetical protein n=1 Tax=unclassified Streptomyces TaxID=2593676 RepID=UPI0009A0DD7A|nr:MULTISPECIES: hypothetical protein [unclassified Streptomyces]
MSPVETSRYVRLRVDLVLEVTELSELTDAALQRIEDDEFMPEEERAHARTAVRGDEAEALAYLVEPFQMLGEMPGVELVQASWSSEQADYDPDVEAWDLDDETAEEEDEEEEEAQGEPRGR